MVELDSISGKYLIKGNQPLAIDDLQTVWVVKSGSVALFTTSFAAGEPQSSRYYLFTVNAEEAVFGLVSSQYRDTKTGKGIIAVALEETQLQRFDFAEIIEKIAKGNSKTIALLEGWFDRFGQLMEEGEILGDRPINSIQAKDSHYLSLLSGQNISSQKDRVTWIDIRQGKACCLGIKNLILDSDSPIFPLKFPMWLNATEPVEMYATTLAEFKNYEVLSASLAQLHEYFFQYLELQEKQKIAADFKRFQERKQLNIQAAENAIGELTNLLNPQKNSCFEYGNSLLVAAGAVGRNLGISISAPPESSLVDPKKNPLDAIANSSGFRIRQVLLEGEWWKQDNGCLLARTKAENRPVALLTQKGNSYILFDPDSKTRTLIDRALADTLALEAYMFYRPFPTVIVNGWQIFRFGTRGYEKNILTLIGIAIISTLIGTIAPLATALIVNNAIPDSDRALLLQIGLAMLAMSFGKLIFQIAQSIVTLRIETGAGVALQTGMWDRLLKLSPKFFRQYLTGDLLPRVMAVQQIRNLINGSVQRSLLSGLFGLLNFGLMLYYSFQLSLVALAITILIMVMTAVSGLLLVPRQRKQEEISGKIAALNVELINGVPKLRVAVAEERAFAAWVRQYREQVKLTLEVQEINDILSIFNEAISLFSTVVIFWLVAKLIITSATTGDSSFTMGTYLAFSSAYGTFQKGAIDLSNIITDVLQFIPLWERAQTILQAKPESDGTKTDPGILRGQVLLDRVTFSYQEGGSPILDDVSIHAEPGEFIALVGSSGSGKSTVIRLLLGFETPLSGSVYYDGQDLAGLDPIATRRQLGVVLQNMRVPAASIFDIISSGATIGLDEAWEAARMAGFAADIERMPMGMHTVISEGGTNLSGGQRQRLTIARSLVFKPKILLFDEATSALDNQTQTIVTESLARLNATRIIVAHRLSTIRNADRIYVLDRARVVQIGTFNELLAQEGLFARLAARQLD